MQKQRWPLERRIGRSSGEVEFWNFQIYLQASKLKSNTSKLIILGQELEESYVNLENIGNSKSFRKIKAQNLPIVQNKT